MHVEGPSDRDSGGEGIQKLYQDLQKEIENLRSELVGLEQQAAVASSRNELLQEISLAVLSQESIEVLSNFILKIISQKLDVDSCSLMLKESDILTLEAAWGLPEGVILGLSRKKGEGISGQVLETGRTIWSRDVEEQPALADHMVGSTHYKTNSFVSVPIMVREQIIGVLNATDKKNRKTFTESEVSFVEAAARLVGIVLENARIQETNRQLAITDELTGLYNYRHFERSLAVEMARVQRYGRCGLSLVMADLDDFKSYNNTYGHQEGNYVLQCVAKIFNEEARRVDVVSRYGGEEFTIIMPEIDKHEGQFFAERVRKTIEIRHEHDRRLRQQVTISSGIAEFPVDSSDQLQLIRCADQALYNAKAAGRNRTALYRRGTEPLL